MKCMNIGGGYPKVTNKYRLLATWLSEREVDQVTLTFDEIEGILGFRCLTVP